MSFEKASAICMGLRVKILLIEEENAASAQYYRGKAKNSLMHAGNNACFFMLYFLRDIQIGIREESKYDKELNA
jgi:hypothetical protein